MTKITFLQEFSKGSQIQQTGAIRFLVDDISVETSIVWPIHPRTYKQLQKFNLLRELADNQNIYLLHPIGYLEMLRLNMSADFMITDSGGLQEECTILGTPCLTLRWNTERPITLIENGGTSILAGNEINNIRAQFNKLRSAKNDTLTPELWDGKTAERCLKEILEFL